MKRTGSNKQLAIRSGLVAYGLLLTAICSWSCSIPNMQSRQCSEASDSVKEFYSWYLGTDPETRSKQPEIFSRYLSADLVPNSRQGEVDPFFNSDAAPTTFKAGKCELVDDTHANVQVQLYWRHGERSTEQREVYADTAKAGDAWKITRIEDR